MNVVYQSPTNRVVDKNGGSTTPQISIAMATYNGGQFIQEQLDSLALQTVLPYELVVTDDGSTDKTLQVVQAFAECSPFPVRIYINEQRLGYADNFLKAASLCKGDYIAFCDQDDVWLSCKLAKIVPFLAGNISMVTHSFDYVNDELRLIRVSRGTKCVAENVTRLDYLSNQSIIFKSDGGFNCYGLGFSQTFKRSVAKEALRRWRQIAQLDRCSNAGKFIGHDDLMICVAGGMGVITCLPDSLAKYRQHTANVSSDHGRKTIITLPIRILTTGYDSYVQHYNWHRTKAQILSCLSGVNGNKKVSACLSSLAALHDKRADLLLIRSYLYSPSIGYISRVNMMFRLLKNPEYKYNVTFKNIFKDVVFSFLSFIK